MTEVRLHRSLYRAAAVDEAVQVYAPYATLEQVEDGDHRVVRVASTTHARERRVARELANYALGLTIGARAR